ncbi:gliding motility-associated ABC transporter substrate-binding protein GldG [Flavobacterium sp. MAH-1]|uniref:Gliding motility-associated ABC transporter substrate-binding protein GldG n=1 Tax=Flavobacterium agri TaxID=2743471 RepID=A0A7Y8Y4S2_9FLAO|nr:gliding motility-associated ABC transporter substrate-binding protein GldG [Flavobacterium agri]NUY82331.1 gliding motility-associated ABC transporter substrate-binding protein GldG [Flavobacterium agri]NYA72355.1 gliding motility-associated ABC transporter substrate-binding protein GldG [Flavobacterium agri]
MTEAKKKNLKSLIITIVVLLALNLIGIKLFQRFDLTQDKRYTLSKTSFDIMEEIREPMLVDVYLEGDFPGEFKKLQTETRQLLEEYKAYNPNIRFRFIDPLDDSESSAPDKREIIYSIFKMDNPMVSAKETKEIEASINQILDLDKAVLDSFLGTGMTPARVTMNDKGKQTEAVVFPWAIATYQGRSVKVPLLKNMMGASTAEKVVGSVQHLEYAFANAFNTISKNKDKKVAVIKGNGELHDLLMADFIKNTRQNYFIGTFTLDSVAKQPNETLKFLKKYDLAVIAKPSETFTDAEKQVLDQFILNGGKTLWLVDQVKIEMDSLYNSQGSTLAFPMDLNLNDMFFKYGVRINPNLVKDIMAAPIALATGEQGSAAQYSQYPWFYSPLVYPQSKNPIVSNIDAVKFDFANSIDTLKNGIKKTVLLHSSQYSKVVGAPVEVRLDMVQERPEPAEFNKTVNIPMAVLLEGKFHSVYENRVLPFKDDTFKNEGKDTKMIVVSDGDVIRNQLDKEYRPLELGYDKWTNKLYGNKEFLSNCVNYLLDDTGLINIRNKEVNLPILDQEKVHASYTTIQAVTVGFPIVLLLVFGALFTYLRKRRYAK